MTGSPCRGNLSMEEVSFAGIAFHDADTSREGRRPTDFYHMWRVLAAFCKAGAGGVKERSHRDRQPLPGSERDALDFRLGTHQFPWVADVHLHGKSYPFGFENPVRRCSDFPGRGPARAHPYSGSWHRMVQDKIMTTGGA